MVKFKEMYTRIALTVIALCLIALVIQNGIGLFTSPVEAKTQTRSCPQNQVDPIGSIEAKDVKQVITLGDSKTFIVQLPDKVLIYQVNLVR